jgi:hypothetical protein
MHADACHRKRSTGIAGWSPPLDYTGHPAACLWWRGEDLDLRTSGYETYFDRLPGPSVVNVVALNRRASWDDCRINLLKCAPASDMNIESVGFSWELQRSTFGAAA